MRLIKLLRESVAAEEAHKLGLTSAGGAYWMDKQGKIVAKTIGDKLVKMPDKAQSKPSIPSNEKQPPDSQPDGYKTSQSASYEPPQPEHTSLKADGKIVLGKQLSTNKESGGTNPGGMFEGTDGKKRYVKFYNDGNMAECEALANSLYSDLGIPAPKGQYFEHNGKMAFASDIVENIKGEVADFAGYGELPVEIADKIVDGFVADCLIGNWDVLGVNEGYMRNMVVTDTGDIVRIDNGSSFLHRGLSGRKKDLIGDGLFQLKELDVFVKSNTSYMKVFQSLGITDYKQLGDRFVSQVNDVAKVYQQNGGWDNFVNERTPDMNHQDKADVIKMLNARTKILIEKSKEIQQGSAT